MSKYFMDLRIFDNTQTTLLNSTGNDLSPEMKTYYQKRLIDNAEPELLHDQFGSKYPIPRNGGKTTEFRRYSSLKKALTPLTEGVTPSGNKLNVSTVNATVSQYGDYIEISDVLDLTAIDRNIEEATKLLGSQAGRTLDTITREVITAGTNVMYAPKVSGSTETEVLARGSLDATALLTPKMIRKAAAKLKRMNAKPIDDSFVAIIHPDVACDLQGDPEWIEAHKYATPENIYNGEIGKLAGVRFVETTEAKIIGPSFGAGLARYTLKTALDGTGSTNIIVEEAISADEATAITAAIAAGQTTIIVGDKTATLASVSAGAAGSAKFVTTAAVKSVSAGATVCGGGAAADGGAVYITMVIGLNAYGITDIEGGGLQHIIKQLGSAGSADPLNQRATTGWKALKTAERLVEENMVRIEHCSASFGATAESN